ncbi:MAG: hypothetical protein K6F46_03795 [Desulfovibrio sp.]|nr:hypothetical protein [Desulfovibrio sp.]
MRFLSLLPVLALLISLATPCTAVDLSQDEAKRILEETKTIASYVDLTGEEDYMGKPENVIRAALFGCYDAKATFDAVQGELKEAGKPPLPTSSALISVNGKSLAANHVVRRDDAPEKFTGVPDGFTCFMPRSAVELAALYFTGHRIKEHVAPKGDELFGNVILSDEGYFVSIDGLGDAATESVLKKVEPQGDGFVLTGDVIEVMEGGGKPGTFRLVLKPGEEPGTWKRQYTEEGTK